MSIGVNGDLLKEEANNIKKENKSLGNILDKINNQMTDLKGHWESDTSDEIYSSYDEFKTHFKALVEAFDRDIKLLENAISGYEEFEVKAEKEINDKLEG